MAFTTDQLAALDAAIAQGVLRVDYGDRKVIYRSLEEMVKTRDMMRQELGITKQGPFRKLASFSKGTQCPR